MICMRLEVSRRRAISRPTISHDGMAPVGLQSVPALTARELFTPWPSVELIFMRVDLFPRQKASKQTVLLSGTAAIGRHWPAESRLTSPVWDQSLATSP